MTPTMAQVLADALGGKVESLMPQSRGPGVRLWLPGGRVALLDELGGAVFRGEDAVRRYAEDGDEETHIELTAEWGAWGIYEDWAKSLAHVVGGEPYQSGGNIWVVLFERPDGRFVVIGEDGVDLYESAKHYESYYEGTWPEPQSSYWTGAGQVN